MLRKLTLFNPRIKITWNRSLAPVRQRAKPSRTCCQINSLKFVLPLYISLLICLISQANALYQLYSKRRRAHLFNLQRSKEPGWTKMQSGTDMVVSGLNQIHELARKLSENLEPSRIEICRSLAREIIFSTEKTLCAAKTSSAGEAELVFSNGGGLHVERFNQELISNKEQKITKRRKIQANKISQVRVRTEEGAEVPPEDGHSWRKYGQKDILGAKYPRSYYRCTHRKTQGCSAMKQVQKSDENSSIIGITYLGTHTCINSLQQTASKTHFHNPQQSLLDQRNSLVLQPDSQTNINLKTEISNVENQDPTYSFSFPSTSVDVMNPENALFCYVPPIECGYGGILSSALMSPTRYESNCYPWSPCEMNSQADSGLTEIICASNSGTDSPGMDIESMLYGEIDTSIFFV